jgi:Tfp pilus assembly PilM family ATPase
MQFFYISLVTGIPNFIRLASEHHIRVSSVNIEGLNSRSLYKLEKCTQRYVATGITVDSSCHEFDQYMYYVSKLFKRLCLSPTDCHVCSVPHR